MVDLTCDIFYYYTSMGDSISVEKDHNFVKKLYQGPYDINMVLLFGYKIK